MSITKTVFRGASSLALFKLVSQLFSWVVTIIVARILLPDDYALSAMATIITSYAEIFSGLGLAHSIIQKKSLSNRELSSLFWFALGVSLIFALSCFPLSYMTAQIFEEDRVIPFTQATAIIFLLSGLEIIPSSLIRKELKFKSVGMIEMQATIISCIGMIIIANMGGGVWTLVGGRIIRGFVRVVLVYREVEWRPIFHFNYSEAKRHISFGLIVAVSGTLYYLFEASDRFFAGRAWSITDLGYYLFALQLSKIPTDKIVSLLSVISFPAFSKLKDDTNQLKQFYLKVVKVTAILVFPLFIGGFMIGGELIKALLGEKWLPMINLFEFLCLSQIVTALLSLSNPLYIAQGKPKKALYFDAVLATVMSLSFYVAVQYDDINAILYPWFTSYLLLASGWILMTINNLGISFSEYVKNISTAIIGTLLLALSIFSLKAFAADYISQELILLLVKIAIPGAIYAGYIWFFDKPLIQSIKSLRKA